jgi:hypothetical protein
LNSKEAAGSVSEKMTKNGETVTSKKRVLQSFSASKTPHSVVFGHLFSLASTTFNNFCEIALINEGSISQK